MSLKARRRADHTARLTTQLNRERGASRALVLGSRLDGSKPAATGRLGAGPLRRSSPQAVGRAPGAADRAAAPALPLVARWTTNAAGRLVMTWSPAPEVEAAPVISLSGRIPAPGAATPRFGSVG